MCRLNFWRMAGAGAVVLLLTAGCSHLAGASQAAAQAHHSYAESLGICRFWHGGPIDRKLPTTHPVIAGCLGRLGWTPDGLPANLLRDLE
jgi:hypothetical protein